MNIRKSFYTAAAALGILGGGFVASGYAAQVINDVLQVAGLEPAIGQSVSPRAFAACGAPAQLAADGNDSTPASTSIYLSEVFVPADVTVTGISIFNGSAGTDNRQVSLYNAAGQVLAASASTAAGTNDSYQKIDLTSPTKVYGPGTYYIGVQFAGNTARFNTFAVGSCGAGSITGQTFGTVPTSINPPTTFTTALGPIGGLY